MDPKKLHTLLDIAHGIETQKMRKAVFNAIKPGGKQGTLLRMAAASIATEKLEKQEEGKSKLEDEAKIQEVVQIGKRKLEVEDEGELKKTKFYDQGADCMGKLCEMQNVPTEQKELLFSLYNKSPEHNPAYALAIFETVMIENVIKVVEEVRLEFNVTPEIVASSRSNFKVGN